MKTKNENALGCTSCNDLPDLNGRGLITLYKTVQQIPTSRKQQVARWVFTYFLELSRSNTSFCFFFFFQLSERYFLPELNKLAFIPEGIKPRNTPSIKIESSDWKDDLNAVVLPLVDKFVVHQSRR